MSRAGVVSRLRRMRDAGEQAAPTLHSRCVSTHTHSLHHCAGAGGDADAVAELVNESAPSFLDVSAPVVAVMRSRGRYGVHIASVLAS